MNPLIERYRQSQRRTRTAVVYAGIYLVTLLLSTLAALPRESIGPDTPLSVVLEPMAATLYSELWVLEIALFLWAATQTGGAIPREIERKSFDFFRLLPLSPQQKALGIALGANQVIIGFLLINLAVMTFVLGVSRLPLSLHVQLQVLTVLGGVLFNVLSLLGSTLGIGFRTVRHGAVLRLGALFFLVAFVVGPMIAFAVRLGAHREEPPRLGTPITFYGAQVPGSIVCALVLVFFIAWAYAGCLRRLRYEDQPLFSRSGGVSFLIGFALLMLGVAWPDPTDDIGEHAEWLSVFVGSTWLALVLTMIGARRTASDYLEERRRVGKTLGEWLRSHSNLVTALELGLVIGAAWVGASVVLHAERAMSVPLVAGACVTFLFFSLLLEAYTLLVTRFAHAGLVLGFSILVYVLFPAVASATLDTEAYLFSGFDYFIMGLFSAHDARDHVGAMLAINLTYCAALAGLVALETRRLLAFSSAAR